MVPYYGTLIYNGKTLVLWKKLWYCTENYGTIHKLWNFDYEGRQTWSINKNF